MSNKVLVSCPGCGSSATHNVGVSNGSSPAQCKKCRKSFRIYMKQGQVSEVK